MLIWRKIMEHIARQFGFLLSLHEKPKLNFFQIKNIVNGLYIGSRIDYDYDVEKLVQSKLITSDVITAIKGSNYLHQFENKFSSWLSKNNVNQLIGLENYHADYSEGTTQAFDSFYLRHRFKKFRCFVGEYFYHIKTWQANNINWSWTNGADLQTGDALVLSQPFCDTVKQFDNLNQILENCSRLGIPVLLDLCYYVISDGININLNYDCIDTVAFSLSKAWPVSTARIGMRYTKKEIFDGQKLHHSIGYNNNLGAYIGNIILDNYSSDYIVHQRRDQYEKLCQVLQLEKTASVCFALGDSSWKKYSRKELLKSYKLDFDPNLFVNRICLNKFYQHYNLFQEFLINEYQIKI